MRGRFSTPRADAGGGRRAGAAVPSRGPRPRGAQFLACAPPRSARSRRRGRGCPARARAGQRATRVGDSGGRGARRRAGRSPPLLPRSKPSAPPPPTPEKSLYLPPPPPPSRRRYPWRLGTVPSSGPRNCLPSVPVLPAAERALGLNPASLEEEEEEEGQSGLARTASPYSPFNSLVLSCCGSTRPPPPSLCPLAPSRRGFGVPPWPPPPLQLSPVIPSLCYRADDPLTSPSAGALPPSLIDSSLSLPRSKAP